MFEPVIENLKNYTNDFSTAGIIRLIFDFILVIALLFLIYKVVKMKAHAYRILIVFLIIGFIYLFSYFFGLMIFLKLFDYIMFWVFGVFIIIYSQEIKYALENFFSPNRINTVYSSKQEKKEIMNILVNTAEYLSKRKIGALITIEREDNLSGYIDKAIEIKSSITQELLTTIFTPGTACHDGAVIIRKNRIMCAGAYFPSTDKYDVPKFLGTRHRAAIGISERSDALTIIVSEETGNISIALEGTINLELSLERLEEMLERYLISK